MPSPSTKSSSRSSSMILLSVTMIIIIIAIGIVIVTCLLSSIIYDHHHRQKQQQQRRRRRQRQSSSSSPKLTQKTLKAFLSHPKVDIDINHREKLLPGKWLTAPSLGFAHHVLGLLLWLPYFTSNFACFARHLAWDIRRYHHSLSLSATIIIIIIIIIIIVITSP